MRARRGSGFALLLGWGLLGCGAGGPSGRLPAPVEVTVPRGATLATVADSLAARGVIRHPALFTLYGRLRGRDREIRSGTYAFRPGRGWGSILDDLTAGRVVTVPVTIPEGLQLREIARRVAPVVGLPPDTVLARLRDPALAALLGVPGPTLEGFLFPDTYRFARGVPPDSVAAAMVRRYRAFWTPARRARLGEVRLTELEAVTLASIVQGEARLEEEMPLISAVYHNRLRRGYPLQADPTVLYALGRRPSRLLFRDIEAVAESPYNTYTHPGLPPGPIGSPGEAALEAALNPAPVDYLYFVARPDGSHAFSRSLAEHNRTKERIRRLREGGGAG